VGRYAQSADQPHDALLMIVTSPALRACYVDTVATIEAPLAEAISERLGGIEVRPGIERLTAEVLAAAVGAAVRVALREWLQSTSAVPSMPGFVVPSGSLPDRVRAALLPLVPALDAAATRSLPAPS
jgi:hypothetical protein